MRGAIPTALATISMLPVWKGIHGDAVRKTAAIAAITYTAVSFVNISVPITQPYLIMLAAWCSSQKKEERK